MLPRFVTLPGLVLALAGGAPLAALEVKVTPARKTLIAGEPTPFRFHAEIEGADPQPAWIWTVESFAGKPHPPAGGTIAPTGDYTSPGVAVQTRIYRIRATAANDPSLTGTALVRIHPAMGLARGLAAAEAFAGVALATPGRLERLAGSEGKSTTQVDAAVGRDVRFVHPSAVAALPGKTGGKGACSAWLVAENGASDYVSIFPCPAAIRLVTADGRTETLASIPIPSSGPTTFSSRWPRAGTSGWGWTGSGAGW